MEVAWIIQESAMIPISRMDEREELNHCMGSVGGSIIGIIFCILHTLYVHIYIYSHAPAKHMITVEKDLCPSTTTVFVYFNT